MHRTAALPLFTTMLDCGGHPFCSSVWAMRLLPRTPEPEEIITLEIKVPPNAVAGPARRVLLLEDRDDFREVLRDHLVFRFLR